MGDTFKLSCESTVDMPYSYISGRNIPVLFYTYQMDGVEHEDNMGRDPKELEDFYQYIADGGLPTTSQINTFRYEEFFEGILKEGKDILHIALGSGMTPSVGNAKEAAEHLVEEYPDRKILVVDSLCSSTGYGLLVDTAADMWDQGVGMEEIYNWVMENRNKVHHQFFSTDLSVFRRSGRVSGPAATVGTVLGFCPLMHLDKTGSIIAYDRVLGKLKAIRKTADAVLEHIQNGKEYAGKLFINHSNCPDLAEEMKQALIPYFGKLAEQAPIYEIGNIIAAHCGAGTVAVFFYGDERGE